MVISPGCTLHKIHLPPDKQELLSGQGELHYLRIMLLHTRGAASFADLRRVNGVEYPTLKEAAIALGVLDDDREIERCLQEALVISYPSRVRRLLAYLLSAGEVSEPVRILERFVEGLADDYLYQARRARLSIAHKNISMHSCPQIRCLPELLLLKSPGPYPVLSTAVWYP